MPVIEIGNIVGLVKSPTVPLNADESVKTEVIWAKQIDINNNPNKVVLKIYDYISSEWIDLYNKASEILNGSIDNFATDPPVTPDEGDSYIINADATGVWENRDGQIAEYVGGEWKYTTPKNKSIAFVVTLESFYYYDGTYPAGEWAIGLAGDVASFNGDRAIKAIPQIGVNYGGTTVKEFLENVFFPALHALLTITSLPTLQVGENYTPDIEGSILKRDDIISELRVVDVTGGENTLQTVEDPEDGTYSYLVPELAITEGDVNSYRVEIDTETPDTIVSQLVTVKGKYPILVGVSSQNLGQTTAHGALSKLIQGEEDFEVVLNGTGYIYILYNSAFGELVDIKNNSDFSIINNFTKSTINVNSSGLPNAWTKSMKMYKLNNQTTAQGTYKFLF